MLGFYRESCRFVFSSATARKQEMSFVCFLVTVAFCALNPAEVFAQGKPLDACTEILNYIEGGFASLVAAAAGLGAIIASAVGGFKAAWGLLVVSVGAFILRSYIGVFLAGC